MADLEKINIKIGLSGSYWDKKPQYRISFNDKILSEDFIVAETNAVEYHVFDLEYDSEDAVLKIELLNKRPEDTVKDNYQDPDNYKIIDDMLLNIVSIEIDDIDLGMLPFKLSEYRPVGHTELVRECLNLGWNGAWTLRWTNPFYLWLLESM